MYNDIKYLDWDSNFFSLKIGQILLNSDEKLLGLLKNALDNKYDLIYLIGDNEYNIDKKILKKYNGSLVDKKVIFNKKLKDKNIKETFTIEYLEKDLRPELEQLAYVAGKYSRFKVDKNFNDVYFYKMYKIWIEESIKHNIADKVFIINVDNVIKGFITLEILEKKGVIGLIAVSSDSQEKGYGRSLLNICENTLFNNNIKHIEVATQFENYNARNFYKKCGYKIYEIKSVYHFWIKNLV